MLHQLIKPPVPQPNQQARPAELHTPFLKHHEEADVGRFSEGGFHLADEEMPDKADLPADLRVLDVLDRKLSDDERLPLAPRIRKAVRRRIR